MHTRGSGLVMGLLGSIGLVGGVRPSRRIRRVSAGGKLTLEDLQSLFAAPRDDHPGRKGGYTPRRGSGHTPRFRAKRHREREAAKAEARG